jgi:hypothetical protein
MQSLYYSRMPSPAGPLLIGVSDAALVLVEFDPCLPKTLAGETISWH